MICYYYDCENRLTDINNATDEAIVSYKYDYKGRRVRRTQYVSPMTQCFTYDGDQIIADYDEAGAWKKRYYYGPKIDEPICMVKYPGISPVHVFYYHYDGLGSVAAMSYSSGSLVEKYTYDVYGKPTLRTPTGVPKPTSYCDNRYMFTGREYDPCVVLYYYRARFYNPSIGRFLQTDPVGYSAGINWYAYCGNNPMNLIDPWGRSGFQWHGNWGGPGWTGGYWTGPGNPWPYYEDMTPEQRRDLLRPRDARDICYMIHDICYSDCRVYYCSDSGGCNRVCNIVLADCLWRAKSKVFDPIDDIKTIIAIPLFKFF
jgi:RHS repeat-associated protein